MCLGGSKVLNTTIFTITSLVKDNKIYYHNHFCERQKNWIGFDIIDICKVDNVGKVVGSYKPWSRVQISVKLVTFCNYVEFMFNHTRVQFNKTCVIII